MWPREIYILKPVLTNITAASKQELLSNEYGRDEDIQLLKDVLQSIDQDTKVSITPITLMNSKSVLKEISGIADDVVVFNLCDGTEDDGYPGLSTVKELEKLGIKFTGAGSEFYENTTSKVVLKQFLVQHRVPTSQFVAIRPNFIKEDVEMAGDLEWPMIIKPAVSYASISITDRSIVDSKSQAIEHIQSIIHEKNGGVFMETFLAGNEFTALVTGDIHSSHVYPVAERVFNSKLKERQKILAFDRYWDGYGLDGSKPANEEVLYWYAKAREEWQPALQARRAYLAVGGTGYGRVDIRFKRRDECDPFVLEVNSNCGLSFGEMSSSLGEILRLSKIPPTVFCKELIDFAFSRK